jgi:uncharacterized membrane protein YeaQ/YmgE (transglycosylase-associated protein family)
MLHILFTLLIGLIVGVLARAIMRRIDPLDPAPPGILSAILFGLAGSVLIGVVFHFLGIHARVGILASVVGACLAMWLWHLVRTRL